MNLAWILVDPNKVELGLDSAKNLEWITSGTADPECQLEESRSTRVRLFSAPKWAYRVC